LKKGWQGDGDEPRASSEVTPDFLRCLNGRDDHKAKNPRRVGHLARDGWVFCVGNPEMDCCCTLASGNKTI
jgi:hypothetical protein